MLNIFATIFLLAFSTILVLAIKCRLISFWLVDDSVREGFYLDFDNGFDLEYMSTVIAWERGNDVYLLNDDSRYLFWYVVCDTLTRIVYSTQLHKIMKVFSFDGEMKLKIIENLFINLMDYELRMQLIVIHKN